MPNLFRVPANAPAALNGYLSLSAALAGGGFDARLRVQRGELGAAGPERARAAGLTDIIETVANVALNIFSNYVNHIAGTTIDFPEVKPGDGYVAPSCDCA